MTAAVNPALPTTARHWSGGSGVFVSFSMILSMALQAGRWEQSMQRHLVTMAAQAAQAVTLQAQATTASTRAAQLTTEATANAEQAAQLQAQGEELLAQSEGDSTLARADETNADEWAAQAAREEIMVETDLDQAAADELVVEQDVAHATADASRAARKGFQAEEDQVIVGACNLVPVLDVVCDVVGGVAAVGLESVAARQAVQAAAEYTAAVAAQTRVDALTLEATQAQTQAARQGELVVESRAAAAELSAKAQQELVQGQADEALAQERWDESAAEADGAEHQEAEAGVEEKASADAMQASLQHGALACWDAMRAGLCALMVMIFFALRLLGSYIFPALGWAYSAVTQYHGNGSCCTTAALPFPLITASHIFHHAVILALVGGTFFGDSLVTLDQLKLRSRGGILLEITAFAAVIQCSFLHLLPHVLFQTNEKVPSWREHAWRGGLLFVRSFLWIWPLMVLEVLLLHVNLGSRLFASSATVLHHWYLWAWLGCTLLMHYGLMMERNANQSKRILLSKTAEDGHKHTKIMTPFDNAKTEDPAYGTFNEGTALIDHDISCEQEHSKIIQDNTVKELSFCEQLGRDLKRLGLPFELLIATSMVALLRHSIPSLLWIWPASKAVLSSIHPHWHLAVLATTAGCILALLLCIRLSLR